MLAILKVYNLAMTAAKDMAFWSQLPEILLKLAEANYIAIDLEMSGIQIRDSLPSQGLSFEQVYQRIRKAATTFSPLQLGITTICWNGGK